MPTFRLYRRKARGPIWQAQVFVGGRRYRFTCHTSDKPTAREYAEQRIKELATRDRGARPGDRLACVYESFKTRAKALGWPTLRPHDLRHSWVSRKMAEGAPAQLVMRYVGHVYQRRRCAIRTWCRSICGRLQSRRL